jgi:hypothetical protein
VSLHTHKPSGRGFASRDWHPADPCSETYDTLAAARSVIKLARRLRAEDIDILSLATTTYIERTRRHQ